MKTINNLRVQLRKYKRYARDLEKYINKKLENRIQIKLMKGLLNRDLRVLHYKIIRTNKELERFI